MSMATDVRVGFTSARTSNGPRRSSPEQRTAVRPGRDVLQSRIDVGGKTYLVRAFVDVDREPVEVVTVYRTSKIEKYWRNGL